MTSNEMIRFDFVKVGLFLLAKLLAMNATILERTTTRNIKWTWDFARQNFNVPVFFLLGRENGFQKCSCVWMTCIFQFIAVKFLHHVAQIHYCNPVAEQTDQRKVVTDENVGDTLFALELDE